MLNKNFIFEYSKIAFNLLIVSIFINEIILKNKNNIIIIIILILTFVGGILIIFLLSITKINKKSIKKKNNFSIILIFILLISNSRINDNSNFSFIQSYIKINIYSLIIIMSLILLFISLCSLNIKKNYKPLKSSS